MVGGMLAVLRVADDLWDAERMQSGTPSRL